MTVELASHPKVKLRVEDFDLLALNGGLEGLERTELLDGDIYLMSPQYNRHSFAKSLFWEALVHWKLANRPEWEVRSETSVAMPPNDEPMPDVILCERQTSDKGIPVSTVRLLIEIADDSRARDLGYKKALYARQGVPEYWVVDLAGRQVRCFASAGAESYCEERVLKFGEPVESANIAGLQVETIGLV